MSSATSTTARLAPAPRFRRIALALPLLVSVVAGLLIGELMVRVFHPWVIRGPMFDYVNGLRSMTPSTRARIYVPGEFDTITTTGPERFRGGRSYARQPAPGVIRIVALGDSFTFGEGANDDESYPAVLERLLRQRGWNAEVVNAGVGGTGTGEQALYFDEYVRQFQASIVVLGVVGNDPDDDADRRLFRRDASGNLTPVPAAERVQGRAFRISRAVHRFPPVAWLYNHSELITLAEDLLRRTLQPRSAASSTTASGATTASDTATVEARERRWDLKLTQDEIAWLAERVRASGGQLVVAYLPALTSVYEASNTDEEKRRQQESRIADAVAAGARQAGVPFLDLRASVQQAYAVGHPALYHRGIDEHPTAAGYRAFASAIAEELGRRFPVSR
jgi:lysophospholipase L1-like esterase